MEDRYLFKAKILDNGEWEIGSLIILPNGECEIWNRCNNPPDSDPMWRRCVITHKVEPSTICQCTGLKEKNGNLIWENDVVKKHFYEDYDACVNSEEYIGIVKITDCAWVIETIRDKCIRPIFEAMSYSEDVKHFEVIGNIFDNPELLESEEIQMNIGVACAIVHNINSEKYSEDEKIEALKMFLEMTTHNGTTKEQILKAFRWFWDFCIEESEE